MSMIFYDKIFSSEEVKFYFEQCKQAQWERPPADKQGDRYIAYFEKYLNGQMVFENYMNFLDRVPFNLLEKKFSNGYSWDAKVAKYIEGGSYGWHCDEWAKNDEYPHSRRIISSITYLNDDYVGGETEFLDCKITPEKGKTLIFPSSWCFPHKGNGIISGVKYIMVFHFWLKWE
jgi:hypothetical protein